jgi:hypothetical protein
MARSVTAERTQRERDKRERNAFREFHEGYAVARERIVDAAHWIACQENDGHTPTYEARRKVLDAIALQAEAMAERAERDRAARAATLPGEAKAGGLG